MNSTTSIARLFVLPLCFLAAGLEAKAQLLFPESFTLILDTSKHVAGTILPELKVQTQKDLLIELENTADLMLRAKGYSFNVANKIELSRFGDETLLSGGFVYAKLRRELDKKIQFEYYGQVHWAEARGMERKYATGVNVRWRIKQTEQLALSTGLGPFYEYERWTYVGVQDDRLPSDTRPITNEFLKIGAYSSYKHWILPKLFLDISLYVQARPEDLFARPRFGSSSRLGYQIAKHVQLSGLYQNIHDPCPVVPISQWYHKFVGSVAITF